MVRLRTLGALDLRDADGQECRCLLAQPKRVALVVYLALASPRGPHRRDALLALFWPELDSDHARNALSQSIHFLRRALGAETLVSHNGSELSLAPGTFWCDAIAFQEAIASGRASEALELYRGDLLEGFHVANAPEFEHWLDTERSRLADMYVRAAQAIAERRELAGDNEASIALWRRLAARDPYSPNLAIHYMQALAASGDRVGALQHARVHETLLREELSSEPDEGVRRLARQLQNAPRSAERTRPVPAVASSVLSQTDLAPASVAAPASEVRTRRYAPSVVVGLFLLLIAVGGAVAFRVGPRNDERAPIRSLAVLPFQDLTGDSSQHSFAEGMHEALITELARYPELSVISRTSVMRYRTTTKSTSEIARELKVDGVVEGAILRHAGRVRMSAQLVHGPTDREVWAERYVRDLHDILVLQSELAGAIAREVHVATNPIARPSRIASRRRSALGVAGW